MDEWFRFIGRGGASASGRFDGLNFENLIVGTHSDAAGDTASDHRKNRFAAKGFCSILLKKDLQCFFGFLRVC